MLLPIRASCWVMLYWSALTSYRDHRVVEAVKYLCQWDTVRAKHSQLSTLGLLDLLVRLVVLTNLEQRE